MYGLIADTIKKYKIFNYEALAQAVNQTKIVNDIKARHLATTHKRLDVSAAEIAHVLHLVPELNLKDKVCLEIGSGWVLSYALIFHLLGARKVIATDIAPLANPARLYEALHQATDYIIRDILSAFGDHEEIRERLHNLLAIKQFDEASLARLGITYLAPWDFAQGKFTEEVDYIFSRSVMNHLPRNLVGAILRNLYDSLRSGGIMTSDIHLEDVKCFDHSPFAFYEISAAEYLPAYDGLRGNRLRASAWEALFAQVSNGQSRTYYQWRRNPEVFPKKIDPSINAVSADDLRTSHIGIMVRKN